jgi:hypothetical protein
MKNNFLIYFFVTLFFFVGTFAFATTSVNVPTGSELPGNSHVAPPYEKPVWYLAPFYTVRTFLEEFRTDNTKNFQDKTDEYKKVIDEKQKAREELLKKQANTDLDTFKEKSYVDSSNGNPLHIPVDAIIYYFFYILTYIFSTIWLFYSILGLVAFVILRFIWLRVL